MAGNNQSEVVPGLEVAISGWIENFMQDWYAAGVAAIAATSSPKLDDVSNGQSVWLITLAGNLLWAVACLETGGAALAISLAGVLIGTLPSYQGGNDAVLAAPTDAKKILLARFGDLSDALEAALKKELHTFALDISLFGIKPPFDGQASKIADAKAWLWNRLFRTPYVRRRTALQNMMVEAVESAIGDFEKRYRAWKEEIETEALRRWSVNQRKRAAYRNKLEQSPNFEPFAPYVKACIKEKPFTPGLLHFKGVSPLLEKAAAEYVMKWTKAMLYGLVWKASGLGTVVSRTREAHAQHKYTEEWADWVRLQTR